MIIENIVHNPMMRIYGKKLKKPDLDNFVAALKDCPTPFDLGAPDQIKTGHILQQGQIGYSATNQIGTKHVGQCIAVIARDPKTNITGLAHVDEMSHPASLITMLESVSSKPVELIVYGARYALTSDAGSYIIAASLHNLTKVMNVLSARDDKIIAAQLLDLNSLKETRGEEHDWKTRIFIDPVSGFASNTNPEFPDPNEDLTFVKHILSGKRHGDHLPMDTAIDLRRSPDRRPVLFRKQEAAVLNNHVNGKSRSEIASWLVSERKISLSETQWLDQCVNMALGWNDYYQSALADTANALKVSTDTLRQSPLYVGLGAVAANIAKLGKEKPASLQRPALKLKS